MTIEHTFHQCRSRNITKYYVELSSKIKFILLYSTQLSDAIDIGKLKLNSYRKFEEKN